MAQPPILYSFRRCPYAIRSRMAIVYSQSRTVQLREVVLRDKPPCMLNISKKATVPVLLLENGRVLDESLDIIFWAFEHSASHCWLPSSQEDIRLCRELVEQNDGSFKEALDRYKYSDRYPEHSLQYYRERGEIFLGVLERRLKNNKFLLDSSMNYSDIAIFPFIRQFAFVDKAWFDSAPYPNLRRWLDYFLVSQLFLSVMKKYPQWHSGDDGVLFPETL